MCLQPLNMTAQVTFNLFVLVALNVLFRMASFNYW
jgi:hypothetical protein